MSRKLPSITLEESSISVKVRNQRGLFLTVMGLTAELNRGSDSTAPEFVMAARGDSESRARGPMPPLKPHTWSLKRMAPSQAVRGTQNASNGIARRPFHQPRHRSWISRAAAHPPKRVRLVRHLPVRPAGTGVASPGQRIGQGVEGAPCWSCQVEGLSTCDCTRTPAGLAVGLLMLCSRERFGPGQSGNGRAWKASVAAIDPLRHG